MDTLDIVVLVLFATIAAIGVGTHPRGNSTAGDWLGRVGMIGAALWLCWVFFRPGGESPSHVLQVFKDFFSQ